MAEEEAQVRINRTAQELEASGSREFVQEVIDKRDELLGSPPVVNGATEASTEPNTQGQAQASKNGLPDSPDEYLSSLDLKKDTDRMLAGAYFIQAKSADNLFETEDVTTLLKNHAINVGNPSDRISDNMTSKRVFKTNGKYRVSKDGVEHLNSLRKQ